MNDKKIMTATEAQIIERAKYEAKMNYCIAKALVEGKVDSNVLRWAEQVYQTQKDIFEK